MSDMNARIENIKSAICAVKRPDPAPKRGIEGPKMAVKGQKTATPEQIKAALHQVAVYAGIPAANTAFGIAKQVLAEMAEG